MCVCNIYNHIRHTAEDITDGCPIENLNYDIDSLKKAFTAI